MNNIAIIILNWNGRENTLECLRSIQELRIMNYELRIIIVDNGSTDGSVEAFKDLRFKKYDLRIIANKTNLGFSEGNNVGIGRALKDRADYVLILNNDTIVDKELIIKLLEVAERCRDAGVLSPKIYFAKGFEFHKNRYKKSDLGKVIWYVGGVIDWKNILAHHHGVDQVDEGLYEKVTDTDYATGACMLVKREVFEKIGLFDKNYFLYWEDADFCQRAKKASFKVLYAPKAFIWHKNAGSSRVGSPLHDYYLTRNRLIFGFRYASLRAKFALLRESIRTLFVGRPWQKRAVLDFYFPIHIKYTGNKLVYLGNLGKGSFKL